jgi:hypothetical protein
MKTDENPLNPCSSASIRGWAFGSFFVAIAPVINGPSSTSCQKNEQLTDRGTDRHGWLLICCDPGDPGDPWDHRDWALIQ